MNTTNNQHKDSILQSLEALLTRTTEIKSFLAILALFLDTSCKTILENIKTVSASTASRFFSQGHLNDKQCWDELNHWQFQQMYQTYCQGRRGRRPEVVLKLDLTCITKTGKQLPFARCYNKRYGVQLLTLHACFGTLRFPISTTMYQGKETLVNLALQLLERFPPDRWTAKVVVMADAAFGSRRFLQRSRALGFKKVLVGICRDRRLGDGRRLDELKRRGEAVRLHDLPELQLYASWCDVKRDEGTRRFFIVATFASSGRWLARRYRQRWMIESFFHSVKYDFGLKEARLRTAQGMKLWIFFSCLAYSLASSERGRRQAAGVTKQATLGELAKQLLQELLPEYCLLVLMSACETLSFGGRRYRLRLEYV